MTTTARERFDAYIASLTDAQILDALRVLDTPKLDEFERMTRAGLCDAFEKRHPEVDADFDAWAEDVDTGESYVAALMRSARAHKIA